MKFLHRLYQCSRRSWMFNSYRSQILHAGGGMKLVNRVPVHLYSTLSDQDVKKRTQELTDCFMEARELMQDARESLNTVYFSEDMKEASEAVSQTIQTYENFLNELDETQKKDVTRTIGLKMAELKAQYAAMEEEIKTE